MKTIDFNDLYNITDGEIIDVREPHEFDEEHVEGAINIPVNSINDNLDHFSTDKKYYLYCRSGSRSGVACAMLEPKGFDVTNAGGILDKK